MVAIKVTGYLLDRLSKLGLHNRDNTNLELAMRECGKKCTRKNPLIDCAREREKERERERESLQKSASHS